MLTDGNRAAMSPPVIMRCELAEAVGDWVRDDIEPLARKSGGGLSKVLAIAGYACRGRNRVAGAKMSEHGSGNALDLAGFELMSGQMIVVGGKDAPPEFLTGMKASACSRFSTVLGPGSDGFHETHMHVDIAKRRGGYRICQWELR